MSKMYKLHGTSSIYRFSDGAFIPVDISNGDYRKYLEWLKVPGNVPTPAEVDLDKAIAAYNAGLNVLS